MSHSRFLSHPIQYLVWLTAVSTVYASTPVVKPTCTISWDRSADYERVVEYRVTIWKIVDGKLREKATHSVKAPITEISCREAGADKPGNWQATIQACLKDGTCSASSKPMSFKVGEK
jgi:hypothetical protein